MRLRAGTGPWGRHSGPFWGDVGKGLGATCALVEVTTQFYEMCLIDQHFIVLFKI